MHLHKGDHICPHDTTKPDYLPLACCKLRECPTSFETAEIHKNEKKSMKATRLAIPGSAGPYQIWKDTPDSEKHDLMKQQIQKLREENISKNRLNAMGVGQVSASVGSLREDVI